ncbi:MAG TPA: DMT family transporter [Rhodocyclaceae bacterium]|nr:DMT family transporter [Rhodocyclaceae bacterium]
MDTASHRTGYLAALGTVAIWTGFILVSRLGGKSALTPYDVLALRLGTAALLLALFAGRLPAAAWRDLRLWALAALGGVGYGVLVYSGFKSVPAAHGAILLPGLQPFMIAIAAWFIVGERPSPARTAGYAAIAGGIGLTAVPVISGQWSPAMLAGDGLILASSAVWAVFSVLAKRWRFDPWLLTRFVAIGSAVLFLPVYFAALPKALDAAPWSTILFQGLYQGIGPTILAMVLYLKAVESLGPARVGALIGLVPVLAGLAAVPLLAEPLTLWLACGLLAVSLGAYLASRPIPTPRSEPCPT